VRSIRKCAGPRVSKGGSPNDDCIALAYARACASLPRVNAEIFQRSVIAIAFLLISAAGYATAHPLGNFSINQYSGIEAGGGKVRIRQVLDIAEIPAFQLAGTIDTDKDGVMSQAELDAYAAAITPDHLRGLDLRMNGEPVALSAESSEITLEDGEGDLPIIKIKWNLAGQFTAGTRDSRITFSNTNYQGRTGWNEIVVKSAGGAEIYNSSGFGSGITDELRSYPEQNLTAPLNERSTTFSLTTGKIPDGARPLENRDGGRAANAQKDRFAELINVPEITPAVALFGLLLAFGLGALHALSPGHGKAVVGAYLVGSRGTSKHALFLGLTVTITHTLGVFALGLITLFASNYVLPERILPFLGFVSGLLVFFIGITLFKERLFSLLGWNKGAAHDHTHDHGHVHDDVDHHHDHEQDGTLAHSHGGVTHTHGGSTHTHAPPEEITWKSLLALGVSGGLIPCPSALVLMLSAIALDRVGYGLILTIAFSVGLAATLTAVGLIFLNVRNLFGRTSLSNSRVFKLVPVFSAFVVAFVGAVICYNSLGGKL
jgi:ABC-type nickel/cobalt efflux system permease component RcnA